MKNKNLWKLLTNSVLALSVGFSSLNTTFASGRGKTATNLNNGNNARRELAHAQAPQQPQPALIQVQKAPQPALIQVQQVPQPALIQVQQVPQAQAHAPQATLQPASTRVLLPWPFPTLTSQPVLPPRPAPQSLVYSLPFYPAQQPVPQPVNQLWLAQQPVPQPINQPYLAQQPVPQPVNQPYLAQPPAPQPVNQPCLALQPVPQPINQPYLAQQPVPQPVNQSWLAQPPAPQPVNQSWLAQPLERGISTADEQYRYALKQDVQSCLTYIKGQISNNNNRAEDIAMQLVQNYFQMVGNIECSYTIYSQDHGLRFVSHIASAGFTDVINCLRDRSVTDEFRFATARFLVAFVRFAANPDVITDFGDYPNTSFDDCAGLVAALLKPQA